MELITYPLLFGSISIGVLFLLKKYFLKEKLSDFNSKSATWYNDLAWGFILTIAYFILFYVERLTLSNLLQFTPNEELLGLILDLREQPFLMVLFFGPVLWIGVALYEELIRVFILTAMWKWSEKMIWTILVVVIASILIGLVHWGQGPYGVVTISIKSLVSGIFFYKKRRLMPLVYAHVLYDGLQVAMLLLTYPEQ